MAAVETVLFLILLVVISGFATRMIPISIPLPLVQMALGGFVAYFFNIKVEIEPHLFFLLLLPPLLFLDGWRVPKRALLEDKGTIVELAFGLVFLTVVVVGFIINWLIPAMPLPVAFALAAILSPTDPIAVSAIASKAKIPPRLMHILEGESLLNDASGLVCMRFAVAAMLTGYFNAGDATLTFLQLVFGGLAVGVGVTVAASRIKLLLTRLFGEDPTAHILTSLLIPFGAYALAEHFHLSGILAAVAAGVTFAYTEMRSEAVASTRMKRNALWDVVQMSANGAIFIILGEQLPAIISRAHETVQATGHESPWWLVFYTVVITLCLGGLRFAWVWVSFRFTLYRRARKAARKAGTPYEKSPAPSWRLIAAMSVAGVRGAITLAGIMTLPLTLADGTAFPARDLAITIAAGVIVISLLGATLLLPPLLKGVEIPDDDHADVDTVATDTTATAAIQAIDHVLGELSSDTENYDIHCEVAERLKTSYRDKMEYRSRVEAEDEQNKIARVSEIRMLQAAITAERRAINELGRKRKVDESTVQKMVKNLDLAEASLSIHR